MGPLRYLYQLRQSQMGVDGYATSEIAGKILITKFPKFLEETKKEKEERETKEKVEEKEEEKRILRNKKRIRVHEYLERTSFL